MQTSLARSILVGGLAAGILDALDAIVAFKVVLGFDPVPIYQFVASGLLGPSAFSGGWSAALLGLVVHFAIAVAAAAVFTLASVRVPALRRHAVASGAGFGVAVWAVMNLVVIPLSRIPASPFSLPLLLNGILGHALLVGIPIALIARHSLGAPARSAPGRPQLA